MLRTDPAARIFCALDTPDVARAADLAGRIGAHAGGIKLGKEFFVANGSDGVMRVMDQAGSGRRLFLDLKLHDVPNTVAGAVRAAAPMAPDFMTVHAAGGSAMLRAATDASREAAVKAGVPSTVILGVTVLTSLATADLAAVGMDSVMDEAVKRLASLAQESGCDGVICSPHEISLLRAACGPDFILMVPGIRPDWSTSNDQKRFATPAEAISLGADCLVIGRPITDDDDPAAAAARIAAEIADTAAAA